MMQNIIENLKKTLGSEFESCRELSASPGCARVRLKLNKNGLETGQIVLFLHIPADGRYDLVPITARDATGSAAARLSDFIEACSQSGVLDGDVIGAVNGGYFIFIERLRCSSTRFYPDFTRVGDPIGWRMTNGRTRYPPMYGRATLAGGGAGGWRVGRSDVRDVEITFRGAGGVTAALAADAADDPAAEGVVCYTPRWQKKTTPPRPGIIEVALIGNSVAAVLEGGGIPVPMNGFVVSAPAAAWQGLSERDLKNINFVTYDLTGKAREKWAGALHAIETGPVLVEAGEPKTLDVPYLVGEGFVDGTAPFPAFNSVLTHYRIPAPRVCVGIMADGGLLVALFEGRQPGTSEGVTLQEAARLLAAAGCSDALNFDGGASAEMILSGEQLNVPQLGSDKKWLERGLDLLNRFAKQGTLPGSEEIGAGGGERNIGDALLVVKRSDN